jgi:hypothetical protein
MKEEYRLGKSIIQSEDVVFHDFATRIEINGVVYEVVKWTSDYETMTRTIELKQLSGPKIA